MGKSKLIIVAILVLIVLAAIAVTLTSKKEQADYSPNENGSLQVHFCALESCEQIVLYEINKAKKTIDCAQYELKLEKVIAAFDEKSKEIPVRVVIDKDAVSQKNNYSFVTPAINYALMHNKFCVIDNKTVITGSHNLAHNEKDDNNLVIIESELIAKAYSAEFYELWAKQKNQASAKSGFAVNGTKIEVYFCPEDNCADKVSSQIQKANSSVKFMAFSFTSPQIATDLVIAKERGVIVQGVMEKSQKSNDSKHDFLQFQEIDARWDGNSATMHHKVFIIDSQTIITGSFNPTKSADTRNDENLVIIHSKDIASQFEEEYSRVLAKTKAGI